MVGSGKVKMAGAEAMKPSPSPSSSSSPSPQPPRLHSTEVLNQCKKKPFCPMRAAIGGFAATVVLGYFVLYSHKKPEASAMDVAKVATGTSSPENTHPRN